MATLKDVVAQLQEQNKELSAVNANIASMLKADLDRAKAEKVKLLDEIAQKRKEENRRRSTPGPKGLKAGFVSGIKEASGFNLLDRMLGGIFGGATVGALLGFFGKALGRGLIFGAAAQLFSKFAQDLVDGGIDILSKVLPDSVTEYFKNNSEGIAKSMSEAVNIGALGWAVFGKKIGLALLGGKLLGDFAVYLLKLGGVDISGEDAVIDLSGTIFGKFKESINVDDVAMIGGTIALLFGPRIIGALFRGLFFAGSTAVGGAAAAGAAARGGLSSWAWNAMKKGFKSRLGVGLAIGFLGEGLAQAVEYFTGSEEAADFISDTAKTMGVAALFGAPGLLVGALISFVDLAARTIEGVVEAHRAKLLKQAADRSKVRLGEALQEIEAGDYQSAAMKAMMNARESLASASGVDNPEFKAARIAEAKQILENLRMVEEHMTPEDLAVLQELKTTIAEAERQAAVSAKKQVVGQFKSPFDLPTLKESLEAIDFSGIRSLVQQGRIKDPAKLQQAIIQKLIGPGSDFGVLLRGELEKSGRSVGDQYEIAETLAEEISAKMFAGTYTGMGDILTSRYTGNKLLLPSKPTTMYEDTFGEYGAPTPSQLQIIEGNTYNNQQTQNMGLATNTSTPAVDTMMGGISLSRYRAGAFGF
jgi:hypothetical protein